MPPAPLSRPAPRLAAGGLALLLFSCGGDKPATGAGDGDSGTAALGPRGDCNPVDPGHCMLPFPSSFFLTEDATAPSGLRVDLGPTSLVENIDGVRMQPDEWNRKDGFPIMGGLYTLLPGVTVDGAATVDDIGRSLEDDSPTVILDAETGERVAHWVELERFTEDPARRALILRPAVPMAHGRRYVVGISGLVDATGAAVAAPEGFAALREGTASEPDLLRQRDHYDSVIFPALDAAGHPRDGLQMAWDFATTSAEGSFGPLVHMRDQALATVGDQVDYTVLESSDGDCDGGALIGRTLEIALEVPLFLNTWDSVASARLVRDADGMPTQNGFATVPMTVQVPCSVTTGDAPAPLLQFGHGLFSSRYHSHSEKLQSIADQAGHVAYAVDWTGMMERDTTTAALIMTADPSDFVALTDRLHQAHVEGWVATRAMRTVLTTEPLLTRADGSSMLDPARVVYMGSSMGSVVGGAHVALSPVLQRAALNVPGAPFSMLLTRSAPFQPFFNILNTMFPDPLDVSMVLALTQMQWDPTETGGLMPFLAGGAADPGAAPIEDLLFTAAIGDQSVSTLGAHIMARTAGATNMAPVLREVWGVPSAAPPFSENALLELDFGYEEPGPVNSSDTDLSGGPHNLPFESPEVQRLVAHFLTTGEVITVCEGTCDPD